MKILEELAGLVAEKLGAFKTIIAIVKLETRLARLSVYPLLLNLCMLLIVSMGLWFSTMTLLGYAALLAFDNIMKAIVSILLLNVVFLIGLLKYLSFNLKNMSFEKTRAHLLSERNDEQETSIAFRDSKDGKKIAISSSKNKGT
jgi:hypothetical protein